MDRIHKSQLISQEKHIEKLIKSVSLVLISVVCRRNAKRDGNYNCFVNGAMKRLYFCQLFILSS